MTAAVYLNTAGRWAPQQAGVAGRWLKGSRRRLRGWREGKEMDEKGNGGVSGGNRTAFKEGAQKLNGRHLILNCSDSDVTQLVTSTLLDVAVACL